MITAYPKSKCPCKWGGRELSKKRAVDLLDRSIPGNDILDKRERMERMSVGTTLSIVINCGSFDLKLEREVLQGLKYSSTQVLMAQSL